MWAFIFGFLIAIASIVVAAWLSWQKDSEKLGRHRTWIVVLAALAIAATCYSYGVSMKSKSQNELLRNDVH